MLNFFYSLAQFVRPYRYWLIALIGLFLVFVVIGVMEDSARPSVYLTLGLAGMLWCGLLFASGQLFLNVPPPVNSSMGFFARIRRKLSRGFYYLLALMMLISTLMLLSTSFRLFSV